MSQSSLADHQKKGKHKWTPEEDEKLRQIVASVGYGTPDWVRISKYFADRSPKQCRERWANHVSPRVDKKPWSLAEELILFQVQALQGNKWKEIAQYLHGRSESCVKNRYYSALRRVMRRRGVQADVAKELMREHFMPGAEQSLRLLRAGYNVDEVYEQQTEHLSPEYLQSDEFLTPQLATYSGTIDKSRVTGALANDTAWSTSSAISNEPTSCRLPSGNPAVLYQQSLRRGIAQGRDTAKEISQVRNRVEGYDFTRQAEPTHTQFYPNRNAMYSSSAIHGVDLGTHVLPPQTDYLQGTSAPPAMEPQKQRRVEAQEYGPNDNNVAYSAQPFSLNHTTGYYAPMYNPPQLSGYSSSSNPHEGTELITGREALRSTHYSLPYGMYDEYGSGQDTEILNSASGMSSGTGSSFPPACESSFKRISWAESLQQPPSSAVDKVSQMDTQMQSAGFGGQQDEMLYGSHQRVDRSADPCEE